MGRLAGRVALVTGAAAGMGAATVRLFVEEGARVVLADLQEEAGRSLAAQLGDHALYVQADVSRVEDAARMVRAAVETFGAIDVLFNNAGIMGGEGLITDCTEERFDRIVAVNLKGPWLSMKYALPHMIAQGRGSIISTSSHAADMGILGRGAYGSAKSGLLALTRVCAVENARHGVRANAIIPGAMLTGKAVGGTLERPEVALDLEAVERELADFHAIPRAGQPEDIAGAALWLASDESSFVTGQAIAVDGGWSAAARLPIEVMEKHLWGDVAPPPHQAVREHAKES